MTDNKITISASVLADIKDVWNYYTLPEHITKWNFADPSWHCPSASNDMKIGGRYLARMEAKDGSFGFDFEAYYSDIQPNVSFTYGFAGREVMVTFNEENGLTKVTVTFDPETENPIELQKNGWQAILNNFKKYVDQKVVL